MLGKPLLCKISGTELLDLYGYEPYAGTTIAQRWLYLTYDWKPSHSEELGHLRQIMLTIHRDLCPDDERWKS